MAVPIVQIDSRLQVAEQNLASQLQGLRSSLTDKSSGDSTDNLTDLVEELDSMRQQLEHQRTLHEEDISKLKLQLSQAEEDSYSQIDLSLKLEEEKAIIAENLSSLQNTLESERSSHEAETNILLQKLENAELSVERLTQHEEQALMELGAELQSSRDEVSALRVKCEESQQKYESLIVKVRELNDREIEYLDKIKQLDQLQKEEFDQLQAKIKSQGEEIDQLRTAQVVTVKEVTVSPRRIKSPRQGGEDETDFIPQPYTPHEINYTSSPDSHDTIIGQMKNELEELQKILFQQSKGSPERSPGIALVQELMANNEALEKQVNQAKRVLEDEKENLSKQLARKEADLTVLQEAMGKERKALQLSTEAVSQEMVDYIASLSSASDSSLLDYETRLSQAAVRLVHLQQLLQERADERANTVDNLNTELQQSKHETNTHKQEIDELKIELKQLEESGKIVIQEHSEVVALHKKEMEHLIAQLEDANSLEQQTRARSEMIEKQLGERNQELADKEIQLQSQSERILELAGQLEQSNRPVDTEVVEMVDVEQLEGANEALLLNTNQDSREKLVIKQVC